MQLHDQSCFQSATLLSNYEIILIALNLHNVTKVGQIFLVALTCVINMFNVLVPGKCKYM